MDDITYPTRCQIIDAETEHVVIGRFNAATPDVSKPHIGKRGLAERVGDDVKITLDDGSILWGRECWWVPLS